jgi:hypothetical protein
MFFFDHGVLRRLRRTLPSNLLCYATQVDCGNTPFTGLPLHLLRLLSHGLYIVTSVDHGNTLSTVDHARLITAICC